MSHSDNLSTIKSILNDAYTRTETSSVPKKNDLTFGNTIKKIKHAAVFYVDMRGSRNVIQDNTTFISVKVHKAFLQAITYCVENRGGHFRSFNGDGALAFFVGDDAATRAVKAAMDLKAYVLQINGIVEEKVSKKVDFGVGIAQGAVQVAKSGKAGDDQTKQDLIWVGLPVYAAVELSDFARSPKNIYISTTVRNQLTKEGDKYVLTNDDGESIWSQVEKDMKSLGKKKVRYTKYYSELNF